MLEPCPPEEQVVCTLTPIDVPAPWPKQFIIERILGADPHADFDPGPPTRMVEIRLDRLPFIFGIEGAVAPPLALEVGSQRAVNIATDSLQSISGLLVAAPSPGDLVALQASGHEGLSTTHAVARFPAERCKKAPPRDAGAR